MNEPLFFIRAKAAQSVKNSKNKIGWKFKQKIKIWRIALKSQESQEIKNLNDFLWFFNQFYILLNIFIIWTYESLMSCLSCINQRRFITLHCCWFLFKSNEWCSPWRSILIQITWWFHHIIVMYIICKKLM